MMVHTNKMLLLLLLLGLLLLLPLWVTLNGHFHVKVWFYAGMSSTYVVAFEDNCAKTNTQQYYGIYFFGNVKFVRIFAWVIGFLEKLVTDDSKVVEKTIFSAFGRYLESSKWCNLVPHSPFTAMLR